MKCLSVELKLNYFKRDNIWIPPKIRNTPPKNILVVGFIKGILTKSSSFLLLCFTPKIIKKKPNTTNAKPISQGKIISILKLFIRISPINVF